MQIVRSFRKVHATELELLKTVVHQQLSAGQVEFDLGLDAPRDALAGAYDQLGFTDAAGGDEVLRRLVLGRIIEPTSSSNSPRVLEEAGIASVSYRILKRRLPAYAADAWPERLAADALTTSAWDLRRCCCTTSRPGTSRPTLVRGSASPGSGKQRR